MCFIYAYITTLSLACPWSFDSLAFLVDTTIDCLQVYLVAITFITIRGAIVVKGG